MRLRRLPLLFALALSLACPAASAAAEAPAPQAAAAPVVRIGLFDTFSPQFYALSVEPTFTYLRRRLPAYRFEFEYLPAANAADALAGKKIDFFIADAGVYSELERSLGFRHIATRRIEGSRDPSRSAAAAFIVRQGSPIRTLEDMRGGTAVASQPQDFEGWQIGLGEIARAGYDWRSFFKEVTFAHYQSPDVVADVLSGYADVGIVRACLLEELENSGWIERGALRVVNEKGEEPGVPFPCRRSTDLYPDAVFAAMEQAPSSIVRDVTVALLTMPSEGRGWDWSVSSDFVAVDRLYRTLQIGPYAYMQDSSWAALWQRHKEQVIPFIALLLLLIAYEARLHYLVRVRTRDLTEALAQKEVAESDAKQSRRRLSSLERAGVISQMSSMIAHELKQPLASISNYAAGLREHWKAAGKAPGAMEERAVGAIAEEAGRAAAIVDRVRAYAKNQAGPMEVCCLSDIVKKAVRTYERNVEDPLEVGLEIEEGLYVSGHRLELELLVLNLVRNASQAVREEPRPLVAVVLSQLLGKVQLRVCDNGPRISDEAFKRLTEISESMKPEGLGLGLAIVRDIADRHGASIRFERREPRGLLAVVTMDAVEVFGKQQGAGAASKVKEGEA